VKQQQGNYNNGKRSGEWVFWNEDGKMLRKDIYRGGYPQKSILMDDVSDSLYH
jgi:antitoxin component YwqK of YwqJK toxin-antitoxin module